MAFAATLETGSTERVGRNKKTVYEFTNGDGDTGGTVDTGLGYIEDVRISLTSHYNAALPRFTISAPNVTIETSDNVDGRLVVEGRGVA